jgi:protocatechuate 3,4-dioxygenase beta subunit
MTSKPTIVVAAVLLCAVSMVAIATQQAPVQTPGTGVVAGQVIDETTKRPVGGAVVTLSAMAAPGQPPISAAQARRGVAVANSEGRFVFRDVPAGTFSLAATQNGYAPGATGRRRPNGPSGTFTLTDGSRITDAVIAMWRFSTISGTVRDDRGEPVIGVYVTAYRRVMTADGPTWSLNGSAGEASDDRGQFRVNGLAPGTYAVGISSSTHSNSAAGVAAYRAAMRADRPR